MRVCHHCGFEFAAAAPQCPLCQTPAGSTESDRAVGGHTEGIAWEDAGEGFPSNLVQTWLECVTHPADFFSRLDLSASLPRPVFYYLIISMLSAFFYMAWGSPGFDDWGSAMGVQAEELDSASSSFRLLYFFATPFVSLLAIGFGALVYHVFTLFLAPNGRRLSVTARVLCYAGSPGVLTVIPWVGSLVGGIWSLVLLIVGMREVHRTTTGRAAAIVLLPAALMIVLVVSLTLLLVFLLASSSSGFSR